MQFAIRAQSYLRPFIFCNQIRVFASKLQILPTFFALSAILLAQAEKKVFQTGDKQSIRFNSITFRTRHSREKPGIRRLEKPVAA